MAQPAETPSISPESRSGTFVDRRRFLALVGSFAAGATATGCRANAAFDTTTLSRSELLDAIGAERARALGRRYREMTSTERDAESLRSAILRPMPWSARLPWSTAPRLDELIRGDYEAGRTVVVLGWILSTTEARQCALFSLVDA